jgi:hypothetical protein
MKTRLILPALAIFLGTSIILGKEPWQEKPYTDWRIEDLVQLTQDSPWAKRLFITTGTVRRYAGTEHVTVPVRNRAGGVVGYKTVARPRTRTTSIEAQVVVQWASSLTLRQARVRQGQLKGIMTSERTSELLAPSPDRYVIAVRGAYLRAVLNGMDTSKQDSILRSVHLKPKQSKTKLYPTEMRIFTAGEPEDLFMGEPVVWFLFPRQLDGKPAIAANERKVEFHWKLRDFNIRDVHANFDLREMIRDGKRDL